VFIQNINGQGTRNIQALWLSWGLGLANFLFTFPAYWWIDKYGRRFLLLATYPGMILSLLGACLSFLGGDSDTASGGDETARIVRVCVFIFLFIFFYSLGQGPGTLDGDHCFQSLMPLTSSLSGLCIRSRGVSPLESRGWDECNALRKPDGCWLV
jgi:MFS family permease